MTQRRSFLKDRKREKEDHLQQAFDREGVHKEKQKDSTTIRASIRAAEVIEDLKYTKRKKSALAALDEIIDVYLKYKDKEIED